MPKYIHIVVLWLFASLFAGCGGSDDEITSAGDPVLVDLSISVSLADVSLPGTRAAADALPAGNNEKMHTLRIIVVRPDGTVEANRLVNLAVAADHREERFKVLGNEMKKVYLFANEETTLAAPGETRRKVVNYDLASISEGSIFPADEISALTIRLNHDCEQLTGPLPMSECHDISVGNTDSSHRLFITRAAVKFTFRITNNSGRPINLTGLTISRMARAEYLMPRDAVYHETEIDGVPCREIVSYSIPAAEGDYNYGKDSLLTVGLPVGVTTTLDPIYLLEGKYEDSNDPRNYSMAIYYDGISLGEYFPALATLPRNTHVIVNITIGLTGVVWLADVLPYISIPLDPVFGL